MSIQNNKIEGMGGEGLQWVYRIPRAGVNRVTMNIPTNTNEGSRTTKSIQTNKSRVHMATMSIQTK